MTSKKVTLRLALTLREQLHAQVKRDRYGPKGISEWVREAFLMMLDHDPALAHVGQGDALEGTRDTVLVLYLSPELRTLLYNKVIDLRTRNRLFEGPQSVLLRSVIRFRLDRPVLNYSEAYPVLLEQHRARGDLWR